MPKSDKRYRDWILSLKKRQSWIKGKTKDTDERVRKISETFRKKKIDNFLKWRQEKQKQGIIRSTYPAFKRSGELAFLIGMVLGDGNIGKFLRTERLVVALNSKYPLLVDYVSYIMTKFFEKEAIVHRVKTSNCVRIWVYQKKISERLRIPSGNKRWITSGIPKWVWQTRKYLIECLKGLFEAEGSLSIHLPTCTYNFSFTNKNQKLLDDVEKALRNLGFNPEIRSDRIRLRKKKEVFIFKDLIRFREYKIAG
ncbi:LAGLIDADG family homing endonuclease [Patescibacteria group bacterium]|nr:LAGLIDADG family homing endonuclease [Patescibacteria group bacterium]